MTDATFSRTGFGVLDDTGRPVGVLVHDSRNLHGAACRICCDPVYDQSSWVLSARWLARHLADGHVDLATGELFDGVDEPVIDTSHLRPSRHVARIVAQARGALSTRARGAA